MGHRVGGSPPGLARTGLARTEVVGVQGLDGAAVQAWAAAAASALAAARGRLDALNVFPVADADTGTNLYLTIAQGADEVAALQSPAAADLAMRAFARGALLGARGNSGVIASQFLLGLASALPASLGSTAGSTAGPGARGFDAATLAAGLDAAQRAARSAMARPVEGTILTAATAAAVAARTAADAGADLAGTALAALGGAREALVRTTAELAVLRAAAVVDAGAAGLVVMLEALVGVLTGRRAPGTVSIPAPGRARPGAGGPDATAAGGHRDGEFEVMYLLESDDGADLAAALSAKLQALGESVAVVGGPDLWQVHVHTDDPAAAVAAGSIGTQRQVTVRLLGTLGTDGDGAQAGPGTPGTRGHRRPARRPADRLGLVVGTTAPALISQLARGGAVVMVLTGGPASPASVLRAVIDTGAARVAVLPGSVQAHSAALAAAEALTSGRAGLVGAARARPQVRTHVFEALDDVHVVAGLAAAVASRSARATTSTVPAAPPVDDLAAIGSAVAAVRTAEVVGPDAGAALRVADDLLAAGGDLLTMLRGADAGEGVLGALLEHLARAYPALEVVVLDGGQASPALALAVE